MTDIATNVDDQPSFSSFNFMRRNRLGTDRDKFKRRRGGRARQGRNQNEGGRLNREICEKSEKQEDEEISRGDAENAEKKKHNYWKDLTTLKKETNRISPKTTSSFR